MKIKGIVYRKDESPETFVWRCTNISNCNRVNIQISHKPHIEELAKICDKIENQTNLITQVTNYYV